MAMMIIVLEYLKLIKREEANFLKSWTQTLTTF